jgi:outer membrane protein assembly factor BamD (BamD/ComL family)
MPKVSTHVRGEAYGELGIAYKNLGDTKKAVETFKKLIQLNPDTDYAKRAEDELRKLKKS